MFHVEHNRPPAVAHLPSCPYTPMYAITELSDQFWRITLPLPSVRHLPAARPINVYLLHGGAPALINAGHAASTRNLSAALHEIGCSPARIERIVATSWNPEVLGGALSFPHADLFVASPDMRAPRAYDTWLGQGRKEWEEALEVALDQDIIAEGLEEGAAEAFFDAYFAPVTDDLDFIPLRQGHILAMG